MIEGRQQGDAVEPIGIELGQCGDAGVDGQQVVQPRRGEEFLGGTEEGRLLSGNGVDVVTDDSFGIDAGGGGEQFDDVRLSEIGQTDDGSGMTLLVQGQTLVDLPVQVDRELRDAGDRPGSGEHDAAVGKAEPPGEGELAVEPRIQQRPAVDLHSHLTGALDGVLAAGFELESGGIGVGTEHAEPGSRLGDGGIHPSDERAVADDVVSGPGRQRPGNGLVETGESGLFHAFRSGGHRVV